MIHPSEVWNFVSAHGVYLGISMACGGWAMTAAKEFVSIRKLRADLLAASDIPECSEPPRVDDLSDDSAPLLIRRLPGRCAAIAGLATLILATPVGLIVFVYRYFSWGPTTVIVVGAYLGMNFLKSLWKFLIPKRWRISAGLWLTGLFLRSETEEAQHQSMWRA